MQAATPPTQFRLGIDFGTSHTTAILRWPDGHARPLLFDGSPLLPSAVYADPGGRLLVGRDAIHAARLDPARFEPTPKRRVADAGAQSTVHLGDQEVGVTAMVAAVLARVRDEAVRVSGVRAGDLAVTLTHPAAWSVERTNVLAEACRQAELPDPRLVPEPVAAAGYFSAVLGRTISPGSALVVYDFGGGTFDASVVSPADGGYVVLAIDGLADVGGVDLDAALLQHVAQTHREADPEAWRRLEEPQTAADRRHRRHLIEDIRTAKEMLSRADSATVPLPLLEQEAHLTRAEFETLARPMLERTIRTTVGVIAAADLQPGGVAAVLLVGGSSRIPLVAQLLREGTSLEPATIDQPETVVAEGSVRLAGGATGDTRVGSSVPVANPDLPTEPAALAPPAAPPVVAAPVAAPARSDALDPTLVAPAVPAQPRGYAAGVASPYPPAAPAYPGYGTATAPGHGYPAAPPQSSPYPPQPYQAYPAPPRKRRRWPVVLVSALMVIAIAGAGVYLVPGPWSGLVHPGSTTSPTPPGRDQTVPRPLPPAWVPTDFTFIVDDASTRAVEAGSGNNNVGSCTYSADGVLVVKRADQGVIGCRMTDEAKGENITDAAVEARIAVRTGCAGMWMRTSATGYFLSTCADGTVSLYRLADLDPGSDNRLAQWRPTFNTNDVVVGLRAQKSTLTVFVNGEPMGNGVSDETIKSGRLAVGGFAPNAQGVDATILQYRAWRLP